MFDLITGTCERPLRARSFTSKLVAIATHVVVISSSSPRRRRRRRHHHQRRWPVRALR